MHEVVELEESAHGIVHSALNVYNILIKDSGRAVISGFGHAKACRIRPSRSLNVILTKSLIRLSRTFKKALPVITRNTDTWLVIFRYTSCLTPSSTGAGVNAR